LFGSLDCFQTDNDVRDGLAVAGQGVFGLGRGKFGYFSFVDFFGFFDSEPWKLACRPRRAGRAELERWEWIMAG
jgi:hypothetical protein